MSYVFQPFFGGLSFKLKGFDEKTQAYRNISEWVTAAGGKLFSTDFPLEVDYLVTPCNGGGSGHLFKQHLSIIWLLDCLDQSQLLDVAYYHQIIKIDRELKPLEGVIAGIFIYNNREKQFLDEVVECLGGQSQDIFTKCDDKDKRLRVSTHLISAELDQMPQHQIFMGPYMAALEWEVPVVTVNWIRACLGEKKWVCESPFLVGDSTFFTPTKPMPRESCTVKFTCSSTTEDEDKIEKKSVEHDRPKMKIDWMKRICNDDMDEDIKSINREQAEVIMKLEKALNFLKNNQVKNEECFVDIKDSVDNVLTSLKFLPTEPSFDILPMEIKSHIFSYLCDSTALVASLVCQEWREIFKKYRMKQVKEVTIGEHCSNQYSCTNITCFMPEEVLMASVSLDLDVPLYNCSNEFELEQLVGDLERKDKPMESIVLRDVDLDDNEYSIANQDRLISCIMNNTRRLTIEQNENGIMLDAANLFYYLSSLSKDSKLLELNLLYMKYDDHDSEIADAMASALCEVFSVKIGPKFNLNPELLNLIISFIYPEDNISFLDIDQNIDWSTLMRPEDLKTLIENMRGVKFKGTFTTEQLDLVRSLPGVQASSHRISKTWPVLVKN